MQWIEKKIGDMRDADISSSLVLTDSTKELYDQFGFKMDRYGKPFIKED